MLCIWAMQFFVPSYNPVSPQGDPAPLDTRELRVGSLGQEELRGARPDDATLSAARREAALAASNDVR